MLFRSVGRQPPLVLVDSRLQTPPEAALFGVSGRPVWVYAAEDHPQARAALEARGAHVTQLGGAGGKVDLAALLKDLAGRGVNELHVEAGFKLNGSLLREGCVDEVLLYLNPSVLGDTAQGLFDVPAPVGLDQRRRLRIVSLDRLGEDLRIVARPAA